MDKDTDIGGVRGRFPETRHSVVLAARSADPAVRERAFGALVHGYWKPVYKYLRIKWRASDDEAKDLTQAFFTRALEKGFFDRFDPARARFRTFLRSCLDGFVQNERRAAARIKRGGDAVLLSLDFEGAEGELRQLDPPDPLDVEDYFYKEWVRSLFAHAVEALERSCCAAGKQRHFELFRRYDLEPDTGARRPSYRELAEEHGLPVTQVTNHLSAVRREFRSLVLERLRELTAGDEEFRAEARRVLGVPIP